MFPFFFLHRELTHINHMDPMLMVLFLVHQGYQVFPGAQDPRDPRASQGHPVLVVLRDHKGTRATQERRETEASQVNRDPQENWDLKGPQAGRVPVEPKVMQGIKEARELQASGVLKFFSGVIGNSVFSKI